MQPVSQGSCGSCWSFAATTAMSARLNIKTDGQYNVRLSAQWPVSCRSELFSDKQEHRGCNGGNFRNALELMDGKRGAKENKHGTTATSKAGDRGIPDELCVPYVNKDRHKLPGDMCRLPTEPARLCTPFVFKTVATAAKNKMKCKGGAKPTVDCAAPDKQKGCNTCRVNGEAADDCLSCKEGYRFTKKYKDCTGICTYDAAAEPVYIDAEEIAGCPADAGKEGVPCNKATQMIQHELMTNGPGALYR